ncbi:MAG: zinc ABC transporter substrate-binding protein [Pseudomonadota bacterium]
MAINIISLGDQTGLRQMHKFRSAFVVLFTAIFGVSVASADTVKVVATTGMIADAVIEIAGDQVDLKSLMGPGVDPHAYRQTRSDIVAMARADLVLWNGLFLEAQMQDFLTDLAGQTRVVAVAEGLPEDVLVAHDDYTNQFDPHLWMDPARWTFVVENIRDALIATIPEAEAEIAANAKTYLEEIAALGNYKTTVLASVPEQARVLITAHDAFNYFGAAFGFDVVGIQGISTESEAGLARIGTLVDMLVERDVRAVFVESSVSDRNIKALIEGAAAQGHIVEIGGELYSDAMGEAGTYEGTYVGMIDHNATVIAEALGGTVPDQGMQGKLN